MTREEAIQRLLDLQDGSGQTYEVIRMAIEALNNSIQMSNIQQLQAENGFLKEVIEFYREQHGRLIEALDMAIEALSEDKTDRMTREEAIADIKNNIKPVVGGKSLDMAIEALHREEAEEKGYCHRIRPSNVEVVVRCKDCRHYGSDGGALMVCDVSDMVVDDTDFCSYGERREP